MRTTRVLFLSLMAFSVVGCARNTRDMWEDTKTCGRYVGKGVRSLMGRHYDTSDSPYLYDLGDSESFIAFKEDNSFETGMTDFGSGSIDEQALMAPSPGDPGQAIPGIEGFKDAAGELASIFTPIYFDTDKHDVNGAQNLEVIQAIAKYLLAHPKTYVFIEGHADERGAAAYNLALGSRRANSVKSFLLQNGVTPKQIYTVSYGKERPIVSGHDEATWRKNRRSQFKLFSHE